MNLKGHVAMEELFLGYSMLEIDRFLDSIEELRKYGPQHRIWRHDYDTLRMIDDQFGERCFKVALLHILVDYGIVRASRSWLDLAKKMKERRAETQGL